MHDIRIPDCLEAAGVELDLRRMRLPENLESDYGELLDNAVREMTTIEAGEKANVDEGRQVGHYWLRNSTLAPQEFREPIEKALRDIKDFHAEKFIGKFDNILWIGIGGSGLGPQMLCDVLSEPGKTPTIFFFDNTDPDGFQRTLKEIELVGGLAKTLSVVVSKSGGTPETKNGMLVAKHEYEKCQLSFEQRAVAITLPGSKLDKMAGPEDAADAETRGPEWLARLPFWEGVGGRTSLFSAVGMLPAQLLGFDVDALCAGAKAMDDATRDRDLAKNPALRLAACWYHTVETLGLRNMVVLPYCDRLATLGKYLQQLIMESLGKEGKGITVFGNKGSTDQHSYIQQLREGYADFFATFVRVVKPQADWDLEEGVRVSDYLAAFLEGTAQALSDTGRPSMRLTVERLDDRTLGSLVALFERTVGYYGAMLGINAYHQPGVEAGKKAAGSILKLQGELIALLKNEGEKTVRDIANKTDAPAPAVYDILDRLCRCRRFGLTKNTDGAEGTADVKFRAE